MYKKSSELTSTATDMGIGALLARYGAGSLTSKLDTHTLQNFINNHNNGEALTNTTKAVAKYQKLIKDPASRLGRFLSKIPKLKTLATIGGAAGGLGIHQWLKPKQPRYGDIKVASVIKRALRKKYANALSTRELNTLLPTSGMATVGDYLLGSERQGRRSGIAQALGEASGKYDEDTVPFSLSNPLATDILSSLGGGALGATAGGVLSRNASNPKAKILSMALGGVGGALTGSLISRYRKRKHMKAVKNHLKSNPNINLDNITHEDLSVLSPASSVHSNAKLLVHKLLKDKLEDNKEITDRSYEQTLGLPSGLSSALDLGGRALSSTTRLPVNIGALYVGEKARRNALDLRKELNI